MTESRAVPSPGPSADDRMTLIAVAVLAFVLADVAHEVIGHGAAFVAMGGRACELVQPIGRDDRDGPRRVRRLVWIAYLAAGVVACAGALPDPRGASQVLYSAVPETFLGNLFLLLEPRLLSGSPVASGTVPETARIARSRGWIVAAALALEAYVGLLGPGVAVAL